MSQTLLPIEPERLRDLAARALLELVGGPDVLNMLVDHHEHGVPYRQLEVRYGLSSTAIHRRIRHARTALRRLNALPSHWSTSLPPKPEKLLT